MSYTPEAPLWFRRRLREQEPRPARVREWSVTIAQPLRLLVVVLLGGFLITLVLFFGLIAAMVRPRR